MKWHGPKTVKGWTGLALLILGMIAFGIMSIGPRIAGATSLPPGFNCAPSTVNTIDCTTVPVDGDDFPEAYVRITVTESQSGIQVFDGNFASRVIEIPSGAFYGRLTISAKGYYADGQIAWDLGSLQVESQNPRPQGAVIVESSKERFRVLRPLGENMMEATLRIRYASGQNSPTTISQPSGEYVSISNWATGSYNIVIQGLDTNGVELWRHSVTITVPLRKVNLPLICKNCSNVSPQPTATPTTAPTGVPTTQPTPPPPTTTPQPTAKARFIHDLVANPARTDVHYNVAEPAQIRYGVKKASDLNFAYTPDVVSYATFVWSCWGPGLHDIVVIALNEAGQEIWREYGQVNLPSQYACPSGASLANVGDLVEVTVLPSR